MWDILITILQGCPTDNDVIKTQVIKEAMRHIKLTDPPQELHSNHFNIYLAVVPLTLTTSIHLDIRTRMHGFKNRIFNLKRTVHCLRSRLSFKAHVIFLDPKKIM